MNTGLGQVGYAQANAIPKTVRPSPNCEPIAARNIDELNQQVANLGSLTSENGARIQQVAARLGFAGVPDKNDSASINSCPAGSIEEVRAMISALHDHQIMLGSYLSAIERQV